MTGKGRDDAKESLAERKHTVRDASRSCPCRQPLCMKRRAKGLPYTHQTTNGKARLSPKRCKNQLSPARKQSAGCLSPPQAAPYPAAPLSSACRNRACTLPRSDKRPRCSCLHQTRSSMDVRQQRKEERQCAHKLSDD